MTTVSEINVPEWKRRLGLWDWIKEPEPEDEPDDQPGEHDDEGDLDETESGEEDEDENVGPEGDDEEPGLEEDDEGEETPVVEWETPVPHVAKPIPRDPSNAREFNSWHEFISSATDDNLYGWSGKREDQASHGYSRYEKEWYGGATWDEAVRMATRTGWPEGRKLLEESLISVAPKPELYRTLEYSVAGAFPMVPNYCAGDPECMVIDPGSDIRHSKPIIRIDYNNWISVNVSARDMMLRGAAVISLADTLEKRGFSTELRIVGNSSMMTKEFRYSIVYKRAGEPLDIDRAAFALAHPASMRRFAFAILEQHPECELLFKSGYGYPMHQPNDPTSGTPGGAIYVPGSRGRETPDTARTAVAKAAEELLKSISEADDEGSD